MNANGQISYSASSKFMALIVLLVCVFFFYIFLGQDSAGEQLKGVVKYIIYFGFLFIWPIASIINFVGAWFSKVIYNNYGIEVFSGFGRKSEISWNAVKKIEFYRRLVFRRFALVDINGRRYYIDPEAEGFLDFLLFVQEHLRPEIESEERYIIDAARESVRSISKPMF
jgi:hypothetical protein